MGATHDRVFHHGREKPGKRGRERVGEPLRMGGGWGGQKKETKIRFKQLDSHWKPLTKQTTVLVTVDAKRDQPWAQNDDSYTFFRVFA